MTQTATIEAQILELLKAGNVEPAVLQLAHYEGSSHHIFHEAYSHCLLHGKIYQFCQLYRTQENNEGRVPHRIALQILVETVISIYLSDDKLPLKDKELTPDVMRAVFHMLVWQEMIAEFLHLYKALNGLKGLPEAMWPSNETIQDALHLSRLSKQVEIEHELLQAFFGA